MAKRSNDGPAELSIVDLDVGQVELCILGTSPFVFNSMSLKAKGDLIYPRGKLSSADKASRMKHDPMTEYRDSVYAHKDDDRTTRLKFSGVAFKKAMASAALDIPGLKKAQIGRLVWVENHDVDIFGVPQFYMAVVRMADIGKTPDIRTRAILPTWCTRVSINYVKPIMNHQAIAKLLAAAGRIIGVGDGRQEKGTHSFGQFEIVAENDPRYKAAQKGGGRDAQDRALRDPAYYDLETEKLFTWFKNEVERRGANADKPPKSAAIVGKSKRNGSVGVSNVQ